MIVVGYQGIGKSTLAGRDKSFIDLESGCFWVDEKRADDWYKPYCQVAVDLSDQGYIVFTSSHKEVRDLLPKLSNNVVVVYPDLGMKQGWIDKLEDRYKRTELEKDYKALMNAKDHYDENIKDLESCDIPYKIRLTNMGYDLEAIFDTLRNKGEIE